MNKNTIIRPGALIKGYYTFPAISAAVLLALSIFLFFINTKAALVVSGVFLAFLIALIIFMILNSRSLSSSLLQFVRNYGYLETEFIRDFPIPYAVTTQEGEILLYNERFGRFSDDAPGTQNICNLFKELTEEDLSFREEETNVAIVYNNRNYRIHFKKLPLEKQYLKSRLINLADEDMMLFEVFLFDDTEVVNLVKNLVDQQMVAGTLYIDNYDDTLDHIPDVKKSLLVALLDREISNYFQNFDGIVKKLEKDKYFIVFKRKYLTGMQRNKFDILDEVKKIDVGNDFPVTISMGIGVGANYVKNYEYSRQGIELALGRGGDQVVVKDGERVYFYGGKTKQVEKNTRVKARVKTLALKEVLMNKERIVIMGHKSADPDAFGASVGLYRAARFLGKRAYIVLSDTSTTVKPFLDIFMEDEEYRQGVFVDHVQAEDLVDENTALIIVDANKPSIFEYRELVNLTKTIILVDHHLQSGERIDNLALAYVEPTASSTCEMVSEILQYIGDHVKLKKHEAEAIYAGILIDTNHFSKNTGVRTFEAAAFLRKSGVDVAKVKGLFRDSLADFKAKAQAIQSAEVISDGFLIANCPSAGLSNPTVVAAQVANELLDISGVVGSFVTTEVNNRVYISARSTGEVNVQLVMEKLGGGGHSNMAGSQMDGTTAAEAQNRIKLTVRKMIEEGTL